ncbi:hypothetical protein [Bdellovibrio sp.]|uniref:hypothetical protein n=1 Tax=Bdellovibrio sp. TaxID=28201 RepID=UPI003221A5B1
MRSSILLSLFVLLASSIAAARSFTLAKGSGYSVEPLYGYETVYRSYPKGHLATRTMYGLRLTAGKDILSAEAEYTRASDTETYSTAPEKIYHQDDKYKLGVRSTYRFNNYFFSTGRLGAQATQGKEETTSGGVVTTKEKELKYDPYAGINLGIRLGVFSLNAGTTMVFKDYSDMSKNEFQHTLSFGVGY